MKTKTNLKAGKIISIINSINFSGYTTVGNEGFR